MPYPKSYSRAIYAGLSPIEADTGEIRL